MAREKCILLLNNQKKFYQNVLLDINYSIESNFTKLDITLEKLNEYIYNLPKEKDDASYQKIIGTLFHEQLQVLRLNWNQDFKKIIDEYKKTTKKGFFSKLTIDDFSKDKIKAYNDDLEATTAKILPIINKCLDRTKALPDSKFL